ILSNGGGTNAQSAPAQRERERPLTESAAEQPQPPQPTGLTVAFAGALPPPVNGAAVMNDATIGALAAAGHRVVALDLAARSERRGPSYHLQRAAAVARALAAFRSARFDVAYLSLDGGLGLVYGGALGLVVRLRGKPLIAHHHNYTYIDRTSVLMRVFLRLAPRSQLHVLLCEPMRSSFETRYRSDLPARHRSMVLPNAFTLGATGLVPPSRAPRLVIGHLSNLSASKGADLFLDLVEAAGAAGIKVSARLAGPVLDSKLLARIETLQKRAPDRFAYVGPLFGKDKESFFDGLDVFVFPTRYPNEAQPLVLLEASARGCILAAMTRGCISCDYADAGGLLLSGADSFVAETLRWLGELEGDRDRVARLRNRSLEHAEQLARRAAQAKSDWLRAVVRQAQAL
ncbi:MAG: glycosyltransferase family 4 protein, partial [Mycobacteriales bacterium]